MYIILVYDVNTSRVSKVLKVCRKYLTWVQNSVLEGELTGAQLKRLKNELRRVINEKEDSILLYVFRTDKWMEKELLGVPKGEPEWMV